MFSMSVIQNNLILDLFKKIKNMFEVQFVMSSFEAKAKLNNPAN